MENGLVSTPTSWSAKERPTRRYAAREGSTCRNLHIWMKTDPRYVISRYLINRRGIGDRFARGIVEYSHSRTQALRSYTPSDVPNTRRTGAQKTSPRNRARLCNLSRKCRGNWLNLSQVPNGASADVPIQPECYRMKTRSFGCPSLEDARSSGDSPDGNVSRRTGGGVV